MLLTHSSLSSRQPMRPKTVLDLTCPHLQARFEHASQVGSAQQAAEQEERSRMAALAEQVANQAAQREGETRRRHEEAMSQLALAREKQVGLVVSAPCNMLAFSLAP